jgi:hypothetical protein
MWPRPSSLLSGAYSLYWYEKYVLYWHRSTCFANLSLSCKSHRLLYRIRHVAYMMGWGHMAAIVYDREACGPTPLRHVAEQVLLYPQSKCSCTSKELSNTSLLSASTSASAPRTPRPCSSSAPRFRTKPAPSMRCAWSSLYSSLALSLSHTHTHTSHALSLSHTLTHTHAPSLSLSLYTRA